MRQKENIEGLGRERQPEALDFPARQMRPRYVLVDQVQGVLPLPDDRHVDEAQLARPVLGLVGVQPNEVPRVGHREVREGLEQGLDAAGIGRRFDRNLANGSPAGLVIGVIVGSAGGAFGSTGSIGFEFGSLIDGRPFYLR